LEIDDVSKTYTTRSGEESRALAETSLSINPGEFIALVGPSGCGKTTLLKIASGLLPPTSGSIVFDGTAGPPPRREMGVMFQSPVLLPWRTVLGNILLPHIIQGGEDDTRTRSETLLNMVGIPGAATKYPRELSGGMQQRVAIARALLNRPKVLFMDEPFGALDSLTRETMNLELQQIHLQEKTTIMFVTHDIAEAVFLADRIVVMSPGPGRIVEVVDVPLERPRHTAHLVSEPFRETEARVRQLLHNPQQFAGR
jgi:NitT/TauT family transport system ATP-binding protein